MEEKRKESSQYPVYQSSVETVVLNMTLPRVEEHAAAHSCELSGSCTDLWTKRRATIRKEGRVSIIVVFALGVVSLFGEGEGEVRRVLGAAEGGMMDYNICPYIYLAHHRTGWSNSRGETGMGIYDAKNLLLGYSYFHGCRFKSLGSMAYHAGIQG